jgi:STE24 endopeptidase
MAEAELTHESSPAADETAELSTGQLAEAKHYGRLQLICSLLDKAIDLVYLAAMAFAFAVPLDRWLAGSIAPMTLRLAALMLITFGLHLAISFPLSVYSGHLLEARFGMSRQSFGRWLWRFAGMNALGLGLGLPLMLGLYWIIWLVGPWWWLAAAGASFVVGTLLGQLYPVLIQPLFYKVQRIDDPQLAERMTRLAAGTGLSIEGLYRIDTSIETAKVNAMLAGLGRTRRVLLGDTLLSQFTPDEIEVILAHEIGHHVFRHIRKMIAAGVVTSAASFWLCNWALVAWVRHVEGHAASYAEMPVYTLPLLMFVMAASSLVLQPLQNAVSRHFERQCDRYALDRTGRAAAYRSAFCKLARLNKDDPSPHPAEVFLFHSHPPIAERLAMARE